MSHDANNFIRSLVEADRAAGAWGGRVATRFPPEPNGFLHIGHLKSIVLNFGLAEAFDGTCNLRFDDTNPETEDTRFAEAILADVRWLGFEPSRVLHASDWFDELYAWAEWLVERGLAYVDDQSLEQIRATRGTVTEPGTPSPWRDRAPEDSLRLLREMRDGQHPEGSRVLRARIDMAHPNMKLRDPLMYRIRHQAHWRTGNRWSIYPMYDWAHGQCDALEGITHSLCTLEFEVNRPLYDWFVNALELPDPPRQTEMARLDLSYTVLSKRKLRRLVEEGHVDGWDDPRMPTISGLRRRGATPQALRAFCERIGVARTHSTVDVAVLEHALRDDLNRRAPRRMGVIDPLPVDIVNADPVALTAPDFPDDAQQGPVVEGVDWGGTRVVPFESRIYIERSDFAEDPPPGFRRLVPGGEVRLRYGHVLRCEEVLRDEQGAVVGLRATVDPETLGRHPEGRRVPGVIHWVGATSAVKAELRWYDRLFVRPDPEGGEGDFLEALNPESLRVQSVWMEPSVADDGPGVHYQLERHAYVYRDPEAVGDGLIFHVVVPLKDRWRAPGVEASEQATSSPEARPPEEALSAEENAARRQAARDAHFAANPKDGVWFERLRQFGASEDVAWAVASEPSLHEVLAEAVESGASPVGVASWIANALIAERPDISERRWTGAELGRLVTLVEEGTLSSALGRKVQAVWLVEGGDPETIARREGWVQVSDDDALRAALDAVLAEHPDEAARYRGGEDRVGGFLIGQVMRRTQGKANPQRLRALLSATRGG